MVCAFVGVGVEFFGGEAREASFTSAPDGARRLITLRVRLGSGLMGRLAISSRVSRWSVAPIPSSSLPRRFLRVACTSDFGTGSALLVFGLCWLAVELFDWLLWRDLSVCVGAGLLATEAGRIVLRRDVGDEVADGGRAVDLEDLGELFAEALAVLFAGFVFMILVVNFGIGRLQVYIDTVSLGKKRSDGRGLTLLCLRRLRRNPLVSTTPRRAWRAPRTSWAPWRYPLEVNCGLACG